jgi:hypothetical protein
MPSDVLALQRNYGNEAVTGLMRPGQSAPRAPRRGVIQRVPAPTVGGAAPDIKDLDAYRFYKQGARSRQRRVEKAVLDWRKAAALADARAITPLNDRPALADANTVVAAFKNQIDATDGYWAAYAAAWNDAGLTAKGKYALLNKLLDRLKVDIAPKVRQLWPRLEKQLQQRLTALGNKPQVGRIPNPRRRRAFATTLKGMPGFKRLLTQIKSSGKAQKQYSLTGRSQHEWKDGGSLTAKIVVVPYAQVPDMHGQAEVRTDLTNGAFRRKVQQADDFFKMLLEPEVLKKIPRPTIKVYPIHAVDVDGRAWNAGGGWRAYQNDEGVHLGQDAWRQTLIHEIGHHVENNLPREKWQDIQLLLRARHTGGGGGTLERIYPAPSDEPRYKGSYPATGRYTSKAYGGEGATEVMSMTVEYLSKQTDIEDTVDKDPQQVAIVLRALRPREYQEYSPLRKFDDLLP